MNVARGKTEAGKRRHQHIHNLSAAPGGNWGQSNNIDEGPCRSKKAVTLRVYSNILEYKADDSFSFPYRLNLRDSKKVPT